jgi:hypothetical protein
MGPKSERDANFEAVYNAISFKVIDFLWSDHDPMLDAPTISIKARKPSRIASGVEIPSTIWQPLHVPEVLVSTDHQVNTNRVIFRLHFLYGMPRFVFSMASCFSLVSDIQKTLCPPS